MRSEFTRRTRFGYASNANRKPLVLKDLRTYPQVIHNMCYWVKNEGASVRNSPHKCLYCNGLPATDDI